MTEKSHRSIKREKYINFRRAGNTPRDAARFAGYSQPESDAYKLEKHKDVIKAVAEIEQETRRLALHTREDSIRELLQAIKIAKIKEDAAGIVRAVQEINRMHGYHAPKKSEHHLIDDTGMHQRKRLERVPDEELLSRIGGEQGLVVDAEFEEVATEK